MHAPADNVTPALSASPSGLRQFLRTIPGSALLPAVICTVLWIAISYAAGGVDFVLLRWRHPDRRDRLHHRLWSPAADLRPPETIADSGPAALSSGGINFGSEWVSSLRSRTASLPMSPCTPRACSAAKPAAGLYASAGLRKNETRTAASPTACQTLGTVKPHLNPPRQRSPGPKQTSVPAPRWSSPSWWRCAVPSPAAASHQHRPPHRGRRLLPRAGRLEQQGEPGLPRRGAIPLPLAERPEHARCPMVAPIQRRQPAHYPYGLNTAGRQVRQRCGDALAVWTAPQISLICARLPVTAGSSQSMQNGVVGT
jgi:hypothetical protein